jgi:hypothetical protein
MQQEILIPYRRFGNMGQRGLPETSARNYHYMPRNMEEDRSSNIQIIVDNIFKVSETNIVYYYGLYTNFILVKRHHDDGYGSGRKNDVL